MDFTGKVAIVTGGAQGIGKAVSTTLLKHGMKVLICDVNESSAKSFLEEISDDLTPNAAYHICDVSSYDDFKAAFEKTKSSFGRIDLVMNNAGIQNEKQWKRMIDINFIGVINGIHLAFEFMGKNNGGSGGFVINIASRAGLLGSPLVPIYSATKHAVVGLTRSFGTQYHFDKTGVFVNAICPGPIDTQMFRSYACASLDEELAAKYVSKQTAISPSEIAEGVVKLLQDEKNGALLRVEWSIGIRYEES